MTLYFLAVGSTFAFAVLAANWIVFGAPWRFPTDANLERKIGAERRLPGRRES